MVVEKVCNNDARRTSVCRWQPKELTYSLIVTGTLKGYDQLMNLVLDNVKEMTRGMNYYNILA